MKTITIFGDSLSKGIILKDGKYISTQNNVINLIEKKLHIKIDNVSCFGQTLSRVISKNLIDNYIKKISNKDKNYVVLALGGNDSDYNWIEVAKNPTQEHLSKTPIDKFEQLLMETIIKLKQSGVHTILVSLPPISSERYFYNVISQICDGDKVLEFFHNDISVIYRHQECYNNVIKSIAEKTNCRLIDFRSKLLLATNMLDYYCDDGIHLNELGHKFLFNEYFKITNETKVKNI